MSLSSASVRAADEEPEEKLSQKLLERADTFAFGVSFGPRYIRREDTATSAAVIAPGQVSVEQRDKVNMVISGAVAATPWRKADHPMLSHLAFVAKLDLVEFDVNTFSGPSRTIEGGLGLGCKFNDYFALAATFDRVFGRSLRTGIDKNNVTDASGKPVTTIDINDNRYFVDDYVGGFGLSFLFLL